MPNESEWWDESWNPCTGCTPVSAGCEHCYAERQSRRFRGRFGYPQDDPFSPVCHPGKLDRPYHWKQSRVVFADSMGDFFHARIPDSFRSQCFRVMADCPAHTFIILTKRPEQAFEYYAKVYGHDRFTAGLPQPLPNVWYGPSCENQEAVDSRLPLSLMTPAAKHIVSVEPFLGPVYLAPYLGVDSRFKAGLDWVIAGPETGPKPRHNPHLLAWARDMAADCTKAHVPFWWKGKVRNPDSMWHRRPE